MNMDSVIEWIVLKPIKSQLESNTIKLLYVFGSCGKEVIFVTNDDNVYAFGNNCDGVLGLGHNNAEKVPTIVEKLCKKDIILIQSNNYNSDGYSYVLALTKNSHIYSWGENKFGTLGNGSVNDCYEPNVINALSGENVIDVCCGIAHNLALTESGDVYAWGYNGNGRVGNGNQITPQMTPIKVMALKNVIISSIACGRFHSMALTECGVVYGWGSNSEGQLGIVNTTNKNNPIKVKLSEEVVIKKVCGGLNHTLLLTSTGDVYAFGDNSNGQIGDGTKDNKSTPVKIAFKTKIVDILTSLTHNISLAMSVDNKCYVWGVNDWTVPTEVTENSMNDAFNNYLKIKITLKPLTLKPLTFTVESPTVIFKRFGKSFNDKYYSDIKFLIEDKHIYAQKYYLMSVSKHFDHKFSNEWLESASNEIPITEYSYSVFHAFLKYLYTNIVDIKPEEAIDLLDLANSYLEEELKNECNKIIKNNISIENVCQLFSASLKYKSKELEEYCLGFAANKLNVIRNTEGFKQLDVESLRTLILKLKV